MFAEQERRITNILSHPALWHAVWSENTETFKHFTPWENFTFPSKYIIHFSAPCLSTRFPLCRIKIPYRLFFSPLQIYWPGMEDYVEWPHKRIYWLMAIGRFPIHQGFDQPVPTQFLFGVQKQCLVKNQSFQTMIQRDFDLVSPWQYSPHNSLFHGTWIRFPTCTELSYTKSAVIVPSPFSTVNQCGPFHLDCNHICFLRDQIYWFILSEFFSIPFQSAYPAWTPC